MNFSAVMCGVLVAKSLNSRLFNMPYFHHCFIYQILLFCCYILGSEDM